MKNEDVEDFFPYVHRLKTHDDGTTEKVRKAIAYMHTGGKMGEKQDDDLMAEVAVATQATDLDQRRLGMPGWCEAQKTNLAGLIRSKGG